MFRTDSIHFLQAFGNDGFTALMVAVSAMGYAPFYIAVLSLVTFGVSFRKGFLLIQALLWVSLATALAKELFAMPRPSDVDAGVELLGERYLGFLQERSHSFPSGHVSSTTTFWGSTSLLFRRWPVWALAAVIVPLMPLSRVYLGRHFPGDVIGGFALGLLAVGAAYVLAIRPNAPLKVLSAARRAVFHCGLAMLAPALLLIVPHIHAERAGALFGLNIAYVAIVRRGFPNDRAGLIRRAGRVLVAVALFAIAGLAVRWLIGLTGVDAEHDWIEFFAAAVPPGVMLYGTVRLVY